MKEKFQDKEYFDKFMKSHWSNSERPTHPESDGLGFQARPVKEIHQSPFGNGIEQQHSPLRIPLCARLVPKLSFVGKIISVLDFYDKQQFVCQPNISKNFFSSLQLNSWIPSFSLTNSMSNSSRLKFTSFKTNGKNTDLSIILQPIY